MVLTPGTRLGPYEIRGPLGKGGMGEVYRATDTRLDRTLAIKVLPPDLAGDPYRKARFEREARAVASLNHPHICDLHDVGHERGIDFLVLEYLEAPTLAERLLKGPLPLTEVLSHAIGLADALDHAHRHGVVHRDLKPGNIMLTKSGVKVLDFGLASLRPIDSLAAVDTAAAGDRGPLTSANAVLGTLQYMAPEQLEGREADARTDVFALGVVVYEMATGHQPFRAETQAATIGAILHTDPAPMATRRREIPSDIDRVIARCLAKDPENRWQTARDLLLELQWIAESLQSRLPPARVGNRRVPASLPWVAAVVLALSTMVLAVLHFREPPIERRVVRLSVLPSQPTSDFSLSPDGRVLAFIGGREGNTRLWIQSLDSPSPHPVDGTDRAEFPFWSPDGRFIAFGADGKLKKVAVSGGPVQTLCGAPSVLGGTWNRDEVIVFAPGNRTALYRVPAAGGEPAQVTTLDQSQGQNTHRWPHFLPDGRRFLYLARSTRPENSGIYVGSLDTPEVTRVMSSDSRAAYAPPGYLLFARDRALLAQPFDTNSLRLVGDSVEVLEDLQFSRADGYGSFTLSEHGELAFQPSATASPRSELVWFNRAGQRLELPVVPGNVAEPSIAPDGKRVAVMLWEDMTSDLWLVDVERGATSRLTRDPAVDTSPVWSPDGHTIVFSSNRNGPADLYQTTPGGDERALLQSSGVKHVTDWSLDGRLIVYANTEQRRDRDLWTLVAGNEGKPALFLQTRFEETLGRLSPNGRWMAYVSNDSGRDEVYVRPFPPSAGIWQISTAGGTEPRWRRNGTELYYRAADQRLMAVDVKTQSLFDHGEPRVLFPTRMSRSGIWNYDVTPDGQRFVISLDIGDDVPPPINVVLNWTEALQR